MADALSGRASLLVEMRASVVGFDSFIELYKEDSYFASVLEETESGQRRDFTILDGFLFKGIQLCIPDCSSRQLVLAEQHSLGHLGRDKTYDLLI